MVLGPSAGEGASNILAPNTLRHFSIQKKRGIEPFQPRQRASADHRDPNHRGPTFA
jgi:hypothetical protein